MAAALSPSAARRLQPQRPGLGPPPPNTRGKWPASRLPGWGSQRVMGSQDRPPERGSLPRARAGLPMWLPTPPGPPRTSAVGTTPKARPRPRSREGTSRPCGMSTAACDSPAGPGARALKLLSLCARRGRCRGKGVPCASSICPASDNTVPRCGAPVGPSSHGDLLDKSTVAWGRASCSDTLTSEAATVERAPENTGLQFDLHGSVRVQGSRQTHPCTHARGAEP